MSPAVTLNSIWILFVISILISICCGKEPECPFGSPKVELADLEGRCDRFWICEDGLISDAYCSSGSGFDHVTKKCHSKAQCLKEPSSKSERPAGLARIADILVTKSMPEPAGNNESRAQKSLISFISPLILPLMKMFS